jgi:hypothetical protein
MKLERERDIPAFKGKNWRERMILRNQAEERDPMILRLRFLNYFLIVMPILDLSQWLGDSFFPHSRLLASIVIYVVFGLPIFMLFYSLCIIPRIRKALEDTKSSA